MHTVQTQRGTKERKGTAGQINIKKGIQKKWMCTFLLSFHHSNNKPVSPNKWFFPLSFVFFLSDETCSLLMANMARRIVPLYLWQSWAQVHGPGKVTPSQNSAPVLYRNGGGLPLGDAARLSKCRLETILQITSLYICNRLGYVGASGSLCRCKRQPGGGGERWRESAHDSKCGQAMVAWSSKGEGEHGHAKDQVRALLRGGGEGRDGWVALAYGTEEETANDIKMKKIPFGQFGFLGHSIVWNVAKKHNVFLECVNKNAALDLREKKTILQKISLEMVLFELHIPSPPTPSPSFCFSSFSALYSLLGFPNNCLCLPRQGHLRRLKWYNQA